VRGVAGVFDRQRDLLGRDLSRIVPHISSANAHLIDADARIAKREVIMCDDDEQAKRVAKQLTFSLAMELWQEARMIATFEPRS